MLKLKKTIQEGNIFYFQEGDRYIGERIAEGKYEPYFTKLMLEQAEKGDTVIDIGANIGYDTILLAKKVGAKGRVYAFEPDKTNYEILIENIRANNLENVEAVSAAVGKNEGTAKLFESKDNFGDHRIWKPENNKKFGADDEVKMISLDGYFKNKKEKIKLIKIDTQGWEPAVIEGAEKLMAKDSPTLFMEYWPWAYKKAGLDGEEMLKRLNNVYGQINYIDEYIQIYYKVDNKWLFSHYPENEETKYPNLWLTKERKVKFFWGAVKDFWLKKWIKRLLSRAAT
ncbi:MAG TPA: FkbM family methyltransferase [Patescibacteria group bacterium]